MKFTSQGGNADSGYLSAFNFSSLTDIVMLLLIFFLLTSSFVTTRGLDVVLPEASQSSQPDNLRLDVSVDEEGKVYFQDEQTDFENLGSLVQAELAKEEEGDTAIVVIRADRTLDYDLIIRVLDIVKGAGAMKFFLATEEES